MQWMIGINLGALDRGAVAFARWLKHQSEAQVLDGLHVAVLADDAVLRRAEGYGRPIDFVAATREALTPLRAEPLFARVDVAETFSVAEGLATAAAAHGSSALVVGSTKYSAKSRHTHLGQVARRLLRHLVLPTVVVPPDLQTMRDGPIVLATDFEPASEGAALFAKKLAADLGRKLEVVHVRGASDYSDIYLTPDDHEWVVDRAEQHQRMNMAKWLEQHGLTGAKTTLLEGSVVATLVELARDSDAAMMVVGSRGLGTMQRIFNSSIGSHLAARAVIPVAVVPHGS